MPESEPEPKPVPASARTRETWVEDHLDAVYRYARRRVGPLAEDVTQQAFEALFRADAAGRTPDDPGAYLLGTVRRRAADVYRRRARRPEPVSLPEGWSGFVDSELPDRALESAELTELVHVALGLLPATQRSLLEARFRAGLSVREIASRLDTTEKGVEMRLRRARRAFEARFRAVGEDWISETAPAVVSPDEERRS